LTARAVLGYYASAVFWLLFGSLAAIVASIKLHNPEFLSEWNWLTFGRVRPVHLNTMVYGWSSMAAIGILLWLQARVARVPLLGRILLPTSVGVWNAAVV
jgi:cytochrome c oxidase cbb3-type subunit 1